MERGAAFSARAWVETTVSPTAASALLLDVAAPMEMTEQLEPAGAGAGRKDG